MGITSNPDDVEKKPSPNKLLRGDDIDAYENLIESGQLGTSSQSHKVGKGILATAGAAAAGAAAAAASSEEEEKIKFKGDTVWIGGDIEECPYLKLTKKWAYDHLLVTKDLEQKRIKIFEDMKTNLK